MNTCGAPAGLLLPLTAAGVLAWALLQHANLAYATIWQAVRDPGTGSADGGIASSSAESCRPRCGFSGRRSGSLLRLSGSRTARPDERRAKGAFVVLVGPGEQSQQGLRLMLRSLHGAVLAAYPRPVLLFYADDVPAEQYTPDVLDSLCPAPVRHLLEVHTIAWALPESMRLVALHNIKDEYKYPGYQLMCHWNFVQLVRHYRIRELDYYCRLDTDSRINNVLKVDLFEHMAGKGLHYAYVKTTVERDSLTEGMWDLAADWLHTHMSGHAKAQAEANGFAKRWQTSHNRSFQTVWNEIEIVHVPRFLEQDIQDFVDAVDATHHIFDRRWGDSPLRWMEMLLFLNVKAEVQKIPWIQYIHDKGNIWDVPIAPSPAAYGPAQHE